ncbi:unnamed protein product [Vicia faba]|uniref:Uncharacterized protein n=1 Tax=Vicia faba TaxID=3906 RepID=A0AAV0YU65_VICFA|nr:unnamed protein product [Vicia faba]
MRLRQKKNHTPPLLQHTVTTRAFRSAIEEENERGTKRISSVKSPHSIDDAKSKGICLMITVLQLAQLPNIKVATVLLSSAFAYDIFWVFISPLIFHESVMIACGLSPVAEPASGQVGQLPRLRPTMLHHLAMEIFYGHLPTHHTNPRVALQPPRMTGAMDVSESGREYGAKNTDDTPVTGTSQKTRGDYRRCSSIPFGAWLPSKCPNIYYIDQCTL